MSAFIIHPATMDRVVWAWFDFHRISIKDADELNKIGKRLFRMNADAVAARYNEQPNYTEAEEYRFYTFSLLDSPLMHQLKAVDCLIAQCGYGDVPERSEYETLIGVHFFLAGTVLRGMPEYQAAPWNTHEDTRTTPVSRRA